MSIRELAKLTGTSPTAVSLILNNRPHRYAPATVERVREAAEKNHYVPSIYAQTMRTKRFNNVFVIKGARPGESTFNQIVETSFHRELSAQGFRMGLAFVEDEAFADPQFLVRVRRNWQCDGFVFAYNFPGPERLRQHVASDPFPCVWFNQKFRFDAVHPDNAGGASALTRAMIEAGHRDIAFVGPGPKAGGEPPHFSAEDREAAYRAAMEAARLKPRVIAPSAAGPVDLRSELGGLLDQKKGPTGWIFYHAGQAKCFVSAALERGCQIPRDFSVGTFGISAEAWDSGFRITYAIEYFDRMGESLAKMLVAKILDPDRKIPTVKVPMDLRKGCETIAPPRRGA